MRRLLFIFAFAAIALLPRAVFAEQINQYLVTIQVNPDATLDVQERISYDFGAEERHGIFRNIPYKYSRNGANYKLRISKVSVSDGSGAAYQFTTSRSGEFMEVKIGDPDVLISGLHEYDINYRVSRAINYFGDHQELYWNAIGNSWNVPISNAFIKVTLPNGANGYTDCFAGANGSTQRCAQFDQSGNILTFQQPLINPYEGVTIVVGMPTGTVSKPSPLQKIWEFLQDNIVFVIPILVFALLLYVWYRRGRDPKSQLPIVAQYGPPDNLTPMEVGMLVNDRVDNREISAEIVNLAVKGYIKIERIPKQGLFKSEDFRLIKVKSEEGLENNFDRNLIRTLFVLGPDEVLLSTLKKKTRVSSDNFGKDLVSKRMAEQGYYDNDPNKIRAKYIGAGAVLLVLLFSIFGNLLTWPTLVSLSICFGLIIVFGLFMSRKTKKGADAKQLALGLKEYLSVAEKDRLDFHNDPAKDPKVFEKLLPYAIALGVSEQWAKKFEGLFDYRPTWYADPTSGAFNTIAFHNSLSHFNTGFTSMVSTNGARSSAGSGGSGFSGGGGGGGFGGGGGGSW